MAEPKTKKTKASVKDFLNTIEEPQKRADAKAIAELMTEITGDKPAMWGASIVGFGSYKAGPNNWPIIGFSSRKANLTLYLMGFQEHKALIAQLGKHKATKGCVYINKLSDIDISVLRTLITKSVATMREKFECA